MCCGFVSVMNLREQTDAGLGMFGGSSEKLKMIHTLQEEVQKMRGDITSLQTSMQQAYNWEGNLEAMERRMTESMTRIDGVEKIITASNVRVLIERINQHDSLIKQLEKVNYDKCTRQYLDNEIRFLATLLRREVFDHYEQRPDVVTEMKHGKAKKLPSLEASLILKIEHSKHDASRHCDKIVNATEYRLDNRITELQTNTRDLGGEIIKEIKGLSQRVLQIERGNRAPGRRQILPPLPEGDESNLDKLRVSVDKLRVDSSSLAAWKMLPWQKKTAVPEDTTVLDKIEHMDRNMLNVMHDLENIKTAMGDMDDRLHALEQQKS